MPVEVAVPLRATPPPRRVAHIIFTNKTLRTSVIQMAHAHGGPQGMHHPRARCARRGAAHAYASRGMGLLTAPRCRSAREPAAASAIHACLQLDARASARGPRTVHMKTHRRQHVHSLASCWRCALAADAGCGGFRCECRRAQRTSMTTLHASGSGCASPRHAST